MTKLLLAGVVIDRMLAGTISKIERNKQHSCAFMISANFFIKRTPKHDENASNNNKVLKRSVGYVEFTTIHKNHCVKKS